MFYPPPLIQKIVGFKIFIPNNMMSARSRWKSYEIGVSYPRIFLKIGTFLFQEYAFSLREHYHPLEVRTLVPPLLPQILLPTPFNPKSPK